MSHQLETHVGNIEANDLSTSIASKSKEKNSEINDITKISVDYDIAETEENLTGIISDTATTRPDTVADTATFIPEEIINDDETDAAETTAIIPEELTTKRNNHMDVEEETDETSLKSKEAEEKVKEENTSGWKWSWNWGLSSVEDITKQEIHGVLRDGLSNVGETNSTDMKTPVTEKEDDTLKIVQENQEKFYPYEQNIETTSENMQDIFSGMYIADNLPKDENNA